MSRFSGSHARSNALSTTLAPVFAGTLALGLASPGVAQQIGVIQLDEITVTANLVPTEIQRSGASVSVIDRDEIEASGATQVSDLLTRLPGVQVTNRGGQGGISQLRIRGADPRYTAVFIDGMRVDDPSSLQVQTDFGHMTLDDIEQIELLRGSQSALYGGSAVSGVVSITTRRPQRDGFSHSMFVEGGSHGSVAAGYSLGFRDERFETTLNLSHRRIEGFTAWEGVPGTPGFNPNADADGFEATRLSLAGRYRASDRLTLGLTGFYQRSRNDYDSPPDGFADNEARWRQWGARGFAELETETGTQSLGIGRYHIRRRSIDTFDNTYIGKRTQLDWMGTNALAGGSMTLVYGADWQREEIDQSGDFGVIQAQTDTAGAYAQILAQPGNALDVSLTARLDNNSRFGNFVTGRAALAYAATDDLTLRGQIGRGFRAPSLFELFAAGFGNPDLEPEQSISAELGFDYRSAGGERFSATLFQTRVDNLIGFDAGSYNQVPGESRLRGLEMSGYMPVNDWLALNAGYTFTDARDSDGDPLEMVARHELTLGLEAALAARWRGAVNLQHVAGRPDQLDRSVFPSPAIAMPDYTVVNANLRFGVTDSADIYLRVNNVFDRQYQQVVGYATPGRSFHLGVAARF